MADAYDFWAERITAEESQAIDRFWEHFTRHADAIDRTYTTREDPVDVTAITVEAIGSLHDMGIFWEYGPTETGHAETGHALALTPELYLEARPLARAIVSRAPDLPRWSFADARPPAPFDANTIALIEGRAGLAFPLTGARPEAGTHNRIDFVGEGRGDPGVLGDFAALAFSILFGEAIERDWLGKARGKPRSALSGLFTKRPDPDTWMPEFEASTQELLDDLMSAVPSTPLSSGSPRDAEVSLFNLTPRSETELGADFITYATTRPDLANAMFGGARISMPRYSAFDESLCGIAIARTGDQNFDQVEERGALALDLHDKLGDIGGLVGEGHGLAHVYIDFAVTDIPRAIAIAETCLSRAGITGPAWVRFHEAGLEDRTLPLLASQH